MDAIVVRRDHSGEETSGSARPVGGLDRQWMRSRAGLLCDARPVHTVTWRWRKDDCEFNGRSVIAVSDRSNSLMDPVASIEILRRTVEFGHRNVWIGYCEHPARRSALVRKSPEPNAGSAERYIPEG